MAGPLTAGLLPPIWPGLLYGGGGPHIHWPRAVLGRCRRHSQERFHDQTACVPMSGGQGVSLVGEGKEADAHATTCSLAAHLRRTR